MALWINTLSPTKSIYDNNIPSRQLIIQKTYNNIGSNGEKFKRQLPIITES